MKESIFDLAIFNDALEQIAHKVYPEASEAGPALESKEGGEKRHVAELKSTLNQALEDIMEGLTYFEEFCSPRCKPKLLKLLNGDVPEIADCLMEQTYVMTAPLNLNSEEMDGLYQIARSKGEDTDLARKLFTALIFLDYTDVRFWLGLAYCFAKSGQDTKARMTYEYACSVDLDDPLPCLFYAKYLKLQKAPSADIVKEEGIKRASRRPDDKALLEDLKKS